MASGPALASSEAGGWTEAWADWTGAWEMVCGVAWAWPNPNVEFELVELNCGFGFVEFVVVGFGWGVDPKLD